MRNLRVTYIESISNYVYRNGFDKIRERDLKRKGVGAFAFYAVNQPENLWDLNDKAHRKALAKTETRFTLQRFRTGLRTLDLRW